MSSQNKLNYANFRLSKILFFVAAFLSFFIFCVSLF